MTNDKLKADRIRKILLRDWDPFCVGGNPNLADEYDGFIGAILDMLNRCCSIEDMQRHLETLEQQLKAPTSGEQRLKTAVALKST